MYHIIVKVRQSDLLQAIFSQFISSQSVLAHFPKVILCDLHAICVYLWIPPPPNLLLNTWTNVYETWYRYHGTWAYLNSVSLCAYMCRLATTR
jgi:hypothetical protein